MPPEGTLSAGGFRPIDGAGPTRPFLLPADDLITHGVVLGMTGSGKTGLLTVLVEEAVRNSIPVLVIDIKGDLPNLLLTFPGLSAREFAPWVDASAARRSGKTMDQAAAAAAEDWRKKLADWGLGASDVARLHESMAVRVLTPGSSAGEPLDVLSALEQPSPLWKTDVEGAREALGASVSLLLRLMGRDADPIKSRDHVVLSLMAERRLREGKRAGVAELLEDLRGPSLSEVGAMDLDEYLPKKERTSLAKAMNTLLASPTFESWRTGSPLDIAQWLTPADDGRTPAVILSVAHLDDDERMLLLGVVLEQFLAWVRAQSGAQQLRALLVFDELYGFMPPHPANPPTRRPLVQLMKQGRAFGVGVVLATQNPMDLDYRALSNAGLWFVGRLQTDADRERVVEAMASEGGIDGLEPAELAERVKMLSPRWFVVRNVHRAPALGLVQSRTTLSWMRGPMTRADVRRAMAGRGWGDPGTDPIGASSAQRHHA